MKDEIKRYSFHKTKYGDELLIDIIQLRDVKHYLLEDPVHILNYYDITLITEGEGYFSIDHHSYDVKPGDVIFSIPSQIRKWDVTKIINGYALIFEENFLLSFFNDSDFLNHLSYYRFQGVEHRLSLQENEKSAFLSLLLDVDKEIRLYKEKDKHILRALLYQALKQLDRTFRSRYQELDKEDSRDYYVKAFAQLLDESYTQYHSIKYYATRLSITPNYLNELVKKSTGHNVKKIINDKLIHEAQKKLLYSNIPIVDLAFDLGFEDTSYFIRFFKKETGQTPLNYRKTVQP